MRPLCRAAVLRDYADGVPPRNLPTHWYICPRAAFWPWDPAAVGRHRGRFALFHHDMVDAIPDVRPRSNCNRCPACPGRRVPAALEDSNRNDPVTTFPDDAVMRDHRHVCRASHYALRSIGDHLSRLASLGHLSRPGEAWRGGGVPYRDFPIQYGLGSTVVLAASCGQDCWRGMYETTVAAKVRFGSDHQGMPQPHSTLVVFTSRSARSIFWRRSTHPARQFDGNAPIPTLGPRMGRGAAG